VLRNAAKSCGTCQKKGEGKTANKKKHQKPLPPPREEKPEAPMLRGALQGKKDRVTQDKQKKGKRGEGPLIFSPKREKGREKNQQDWRHATGGADGGKKKEKGKKRGGRGGIIVPTTSVPVPAKRENKGKKSPRKSS